MRTTRVHRLPGPRRLRAAGVAFLCLSLLLPWFGGAPATARPAQCPPIGEVEPNNSSSTAQQVGNGTVRIGGAVDPRDAGCQWLTDDDCEDWYTFTLAAQATITATLSGSGPSNADLTLFRDVAPGFCSF